MTDDGCGGGDESEVIGANHFGRFFLVFLRKYGFRMGLMDNLL